MNTTTTKNAARETGHPAEHTPGPWKQNRKNPLAIHPAIEPRTHRIAEIKVCNWACTERIGEEEAQANARLITAAPELLQWLERVEEWYDKDNTSEAIPFPNMECIRATIAKATQKQS